jgi:hypothetical protein
MSKSIMELKIYLKRFVTLKIISNVTVINTNIEFN